MKKLELKQMENVQGGKLTKQEMDDFFGAAGCVLSVSSAVGLLFGGYSCYNWLKSL